MGRYGSDALGRLIMWVSVALVILNVFVGSVIISIIETALVIYAIFRIMSRNITARAAENQAYLKLLGKIRGFFSLKRSKWRDRKTHVFRKCPSCKNQLRLPRERGRHTVHCPCCHTRFETKIR